MPRLGCRALGLITISRYDGTGTHTVPKIDVDHEYIHNTDTVGAVRHAVGRIKMYPPDRKKKDPKVSRANRIGIMNAVWRVPSRIQYSVPAELETGRAR